MPGTHAQRVAEAGARGLAVGELEDADLAIAPRRLEAQRAAGLERSIRLDLPLEELHGDVRGVEPVQAHARDDVERRGGRKARRFRVDRDAVEPDARPGRAHALLPGDEQLERFAVVALQRPAVKRAGDIALLEVLRDHAVRRKRLRDLRGRDDHAVDPALRQPRGVAVEEHGQKALLDRVVQGLRDLLVPRLVLRLADDEARFVVRRLVPPAVEDRQVQRAVHRGLHARRPGRLARALGRVQPDVAAGDERARERHVVVGQEEDAAFQLRALRRARDGPEEFLSGLVARMRLAGEEDLHGAPDLVEQVLEPLGLAEEQRRALVGREAAREADRQRARIEGARGLRDLLVPRALAALLLDELLAARRHEARPQRLVRPPQLAPIHVLGVLEHAGRRDLGRRPGRRVHAVGDRLDRDFRERQVRHHAPPELARDARVQARHGVLVRREAHREDRHREELARLVAHLAAELEELVERDAELVDVPAEVLPQELRREHVDARGHGRVGREDVAGRRDLARLGEGEVLLLHETPDPLERDEGGVPLVDVPDRRGPAELLEGAQAADAEHDLLLEPHLEAAAVEARGDLAVGRLVLGQVRVEQEQRHAADLGDADEQVHGPPGEVHRDDRRAPVGRLGDRERQLVGLEHRVGLVLHAVVVDDLPEVPLPVEEADARQRHAQVARGLQVVAGEDAEAAGVDRQDLGQPELRREIGDLLPARDELPGRRVPGLGQVLLGQLPHLGEQLGLVRRVLRGVPEPFGRHLSEELDRVAARPPPGRRIQKFEERADVRPPRPPEIVGKGEKRKESFGDAGDPKGLFENGCQLDMKCSRPTRPTNPCGLRGLGAPEPEAPRPP